MIQKTNFKGKQSQTLVLYKDRIELNSIFTLHKDKQKCCWHEVHTTLTMHKDNLNTRHLFSRDIENKDTNCRERKDIRIKSFLFDTGWEIT